MSEVFPSTSPGAVTLFIPCLVDQLYPETGLALAGILRHFGYELKYTPKVTCCGQPAFNAGHMDEARIVAAGFVEAMRGAEKVVCPSGSCTGMVRNYFPGLFEGHPLKDEAVRLGRVTMEFSEFMAREGLTEAVSGCYKGRIGFHKSCHSAREIRLGDEALNLMKRISGCDLAEVAIEPVCCGFGGLFSAKFPAIAKGMAVTRLEMFTSRGVDVIVSNDPGCIMHLRKEAEATGVKMEIFHLTEFLARAMGVPLSL